MAERVDLDRAEEQLMLLLPHRLAAPVQRMRNAHLASQVLDLIKRPLEAQLARAPKIELDETLPTGLEDWQRVPMHRVRDVLDKLARDRQFVRSLWNEADSARHQEHVRRHYVPGVNVLPDTLRDTTPPHEGTWYALADLGLGTASHLESMPDTVAGWIARRLLASRARRILHVTTGASTLAAALDVIAPKGTRVRVHEVSVLGDGVGDSGETAHRCLGSRSSRMPRSGTFDAAVVHLPAPAGPGALRHRSHYPQAGGLDAGSEMQRNWARTVMAHVVRALSVLRAGGTLVLYLPTGIRTARGYIVLPEVLASVRDAIARMPLTLADDYDVVEVEPVRQPFVGTKRCPWRLMVARKGSCS